MTQKNGEREVKFDELGQDDKLEIMMETLLEIVDKVDSLIEKQDLMEERLNEMNEVGSGYSYNRFDN